MSRDHDREDQRLRDALDHVRRGGDVEDLNLDELLQSRPKPIRKKKRKDEEPGS